MCGFEFMTIVVYVVLFLVIPIVCFLWFISFCFVFVSLFEQSTRSSYLHISLHCASASLVEFDVFLPFMFYWLFLLSFVFLSFLCSFSPVPPITLFCLLFLVIFSFYCLVYIISRLFFIPILSVLLFSSVYFCGCCLGVFLGFFCGLCFCFNVVALL